MKDSCVDENVLKYACGFQRGERTLDFGYMTVSMFVFIHISVYGDYESTSLHA